MNMSTFFKKVLFFTALSLILQVFQSFGAPCAAAKTPVQSSLQEQEISGIDRLIRGWKFSDAFAIVTEKLNSPEKIEKKHKKDLLERLGIILKMLGKTYDSMAGFNEALKIDPSSEDSLYFLAMLNLITGNNSAARSFCDKLKAASRESAWYYLISGTAYSFEGQSEAAYSEIKRSVKINPEIFESRVFLFNYYKKNRKYDQARDELINLMKLTPDFERSVFLSAGAFGSRRKAEESVKAQILCEYGLITYNNFKNPKTAMKYYEESIKLAPRMVRARIALAQCLILFGKNQKALELVEEALAIEPAYKMGHDFKMKLTEGGSTDGLINVNIDTLAPTNMLGLYRYCSKCGKRNKLSHRYCAGCSSSLLRKRSEKTAAETPAPPLKESASVDALPPGDEPGEYDEGFEKGIAFLENKDYEKAEESFKALIGAAPRSPELYNMLGITCLGLRKNEEAVKNFRKSISLNPDFAEGYISLGKAYELMKKNALAASMYEKALKIDSEYEEARAALKKLNSSGMNGD